MNTLLVVLALLLAALVVLLAWLHWRGEKLPEDPGLDRLDTVAAWPPQPTRLLTSGERAAYQLLVRALPGYMVAVQVPLARFLKVPTRHSYGEWLRRAGHLCADLVVCDESSAVIAVVDVQPAAAPSSERARRRLDRMALVLKAAGVPLHVWSEDALPPAETARELIVPRPVETAAARTASDELPTVPGDLDASDRLREPPPSTWFDELDTQPPEPDRRR